MPEPITTVGLGAIAAYLGKDGLQKVLGPTAEYLGEGLRDFAARRIENVGKIFQNAERKLADSQATKGVVPPKVLKEIVNEGSYNEDPLATEYLGGVLASSKTESGRDDRGARIAKLVDRLSTYQLRAHFLLYRSFRHLFANSGLDMNVDGRPKMQIFVPIDSFVDAMDFNDSELVDLEQMFGHIFFGLDGENLIGNFWRYGATEGLKTVWPEAEEPGIVCIPSPLGCELFLYALGHGGASLSHLFASELDSPLSTLPGPLNDARGTRTET